MSAQSDESSGTSTTRRGGCPVGDARAERCERSNTLQLGAPGVDRATRKGLPRALAAPRRTAATPAPCPRRVTAASRPLRRRRLAAGVAARATPASPASCCRSRRLPPLLRAGAPNGRAQECRRARIAVGQAHERLAARVRRRLEHRSPASREPAQCYARRARRIRPRCQSIERRAKVRRPTGKDQDPPPAVLPLLDRRGDRSGRRPARRQAVAAAHRATPRKGCRLRRDTHPVRCGGVTAVARSRSAGQARRAAGPVRRRRGRRTGPVRRLERRRDAVRWPPECRAWRTSDLRESRGSREAPLVARRRVRPPTSSGPTTWRLIVNELRLDRRCSLGWSRGASRQLAALRPRARPAIKLSAIKGFPSERATSRRLGAAA